MYHTEEEENKTIEDYSYCSCCQEHYSFKPVDCHSKVLYTVLGTYTFHITKYIIKLLKWNDGKQDYYISRMNEKWLNVITYPNLKIERYNSSPRRIRFSEYYQRLAVGRFEFQSDIDRFILEIDKHEQHEEQTVINTNEYVFEQYHRIMKLLCYDLNRGTFKTIEDYL